MSRIVPFAKSDIASTGGSGPEDPMLEPRVEKLEQDVGRITVILERLEPRIIELHARSASQTELSALRADFARLDGKIDGIDKRLANIPNTWQVISILAALLIGIAGIVFAAGKFLKP